MALTTFVVVVMFGLEYADETIEAKMKRWGIDVDQWPKGIHAADPFIVAAHLARNYGIRVIPTWVSAVKKPYFCNWTEDASTDMGRLVRWQQEAMARSRRFCPVGEVPHPPNWSILTGRANNVIIIDIDGEKGRASLAEHEKKYGKLPGTVMTQSGRVDGGTHIWLRPPPGTDDVMNQQPIPGTKIDIRGWHGHAVIPGSLHIAGPRYVWVPGCAPDQVEIAVCPEDWWTFLPEKEFGDKPVPRASRGYSRRSTEKREFDRKSLLIGDGEGFGNFENPIYKNAIRYFLKVGVEAPAEIIIETLRKMIIAAKKGPDRDVSRYLSGSDLPRTVERARAFARTVKENDNVEFEIE